MPEQHFDIVISGAGCAGMSLAYRLAHEPGLQKHRIAVIDKSHTVVNDRVWCFWETGTGLFESCVSKRYDTIAVALGNEQLIKTAAPYQYKMIRSGDFFSFCRKALERFPNVEFITAEVLGIAQEDESAIVRTEQVNYRAGLVFNSVPHPDYRETGPKLLQHFRGWYVRTPDRKFDPGIATLMDFNTTQAYGTAFVYVLPLSETRALVEFTVFGPALIADSEYEEALRRYLETAGIVQYEIEEKETGVIPMVNAHIDAAARRVHHIGIYGLATKPSTGYTFAFIQEQTSSIVRALIQNTTIKTGVHPRRFNFYDAVLLEILYHRLADGAGIFFRLFRRNKVSQVFRFLSNRTNVWEEIRLFATLPVALFGKVAMRVLLAWAQGLKAKGK